MQHILASTSATTMGPNCFIWDLKQMKVVIPLNDPSGRVSFCLINKKNDIT